MGFFDKVKGALNIGGSKLTINGPGTIQNGTDLDFTATLVGGKMDQQIKDIKAELVMAEEQTSYQVGGSQSQNIRFVTIAQQTITEPFAIHPGEQKQFPFSLPVQIIGDAANQTGIMGALNKINNMATQNKCVYKLKVVANIEGSTDAGSEMDIQIQV